MNSDIIKFLRGEGKDFKGRSLNNMIEGTDLFLERGHDYIQWMFPSDVPSQHSKDAPSLTKEQIEIMRNDDKIKNNVRISLIRFCKFLEDDQWITPYNHNFKRCTRILRCLWLLGMEWEYHEFQKCLLKFYNENPEVIGEKTVEFWKNANDVHFMA
jgi:hypothetical protein